MNKHLAVVHGVAHCVLGIAVHGDQSAVHERGHVVSRHAVYGEAHSPAQAVAQVALSPYVFQNQLVLARRQCVVNGLVDFLVMQARSVDFHNVTTPFPD